MIGPAVAAITHPEPLLQQRQFADQISDGVCKGLLGTVVRRRLDPNYYLVLQWMGNLVPSKQHLRILQQLSVERTLKL